MGTELITLSDGDDEDDRADRYLPLAMPQEEIMEILAENLVPGESISLSDLIRVKVPAGGSTAWQIPDPLEGELIEKSLVGVVIHRQRRRGFYVEKYDGGTDRPDCASDDAITGVLHPLDDGELTAAKKKSIQQAKKLGAGGACMDCPLNVFPEGGGSKPCKEVLQLFILRKGNLLPIVINVTPGSLKNARQYFNGLMAAAYRATSVATELTLKKAESSGGIDYSQIEFKVAGQLDSKAKAQMGAYAEQIKPFLKRTDVPIEDDIRNLDDDAAAA